MSPSRQTAPPEFVLRPYGEADRAYVVMHWNSGASRAFPLSAGARPAFERLHESHIERRLATATTRMIVHPDDASALIGFLCFDAATVASVLHWVYVGRVSRRVGVAGAALDVALPGWRRRPIVASAVSSHGDWSDMARRYNVITDPYTEIA